MASYRVEITAEARKEIRQLPGNMRQRVIRALEGLNEQPFPSNCRTLDSAKAGAVLEPGVQMCRIRIGAWRIVYVVDEESCVNYVLAVRKRPPYQYTDLRELLASNH